MKEIEVKKRFIIYGSDDVEEARKLIGEVGIFIDDEEALYSSLGEEFTLETIIINSHGTLFESDGGGHYYLFAKEIDT